MQAVKLDNADCTSSSSRTVFRLDSKTLAYSLALIHLIYFWLVLSEIECTVHATTVGINPTLSDPFTPQTSKLGWRYFEAYKIDTNELQIRTN